MALKSTWVYLFVIFMDSSSSVVGIHWQKQRDQKHTIYHAVSPFNRIFGFRGEKNNVKVIFFQLNKRKTNPSICGNNVASSPLLMSWLGIPVINISHHTQELLQYITIF